MPHAITLPSLRIARHGETAWSLSGQHTGLTDLPLTSRGEMQAKRLGARLAGSRFSRVLTSPLQRAKRTSELAGFGDVAVEDPDLVEWDYGAYEGRRTDEIRNERPEWDLFRDGCPAGETAAQVGTRADRVLSRLGTLSGDTLIFSSGHFLRVLAARWLQQPPEQGRLFLLQTGSLGTLGYEHNVSEPVVRSWNDTSHLEE